MRLWRISNHADLNGRGGELAAGRWNDKGQRIVYCSDHLSTAMLEILVHVDREDIPDSYQLLEISVPDNVKPVTIEPPAGWRDNPAITRAIWTRHVGESAGAVFAVPSAIMPFATNYLLDPAHRDHAKIVIVSATSHFIDRRFLT
ncbi:MAG TPA: RES family NAD+ phosphorylase [Rhizobiaceae bacterium]|nr:RES family NAD+ phosphorylase [Rhizobiaceae bacterium]